MVTYIYFVKCPNCEDEHFDFFDDAKAYARGCMSQKPIITQTEVCRNDFGECTDHSDLGTVWSWEDECEPEVEPTTFSKDDFKSDYDPDNDPEFQDDEDFRMINEELLESRRISFNNKEDQQEFFKLCKETGMITGADLDRFMQDYDADDSNLLDKLRAYKDELDNDFELKEDFISSYDYGRMTKDELYDHLVNKGDGVEFDIGDQGYSRSEVGSFSDGGYYSNSIIWVDYEDGKFTAIESYMSESGAEKEGSTIIETDSFDELWDQLMEFKPEDLVEKCTKSDRKPVPEGMTIEQLVETMQENEDTVECAGCEELFSKDKCFHKEGIGYLCGDCEDRIVKCTWCDELYDRGECRYEVDLGWLCSRCEAAIKSRGETLTFREGNYWDFLDEDTKKPIDKDLQEEAATQSWKDEEDYFEYEDIPLTLYSRYPVNPGDRVNPPEYKKTVVKTTYTLYKKNIDIATTIWEEFLTEEDVKDIPGGLDYLYKNPEAWDKFFEENLEDLSQKYWEQLEDYYRDEAIEECNEKNTDNTESFFADWY